MSDIAIDHAESCARNPQWPRVVFVGFMALLLLAAATDQRNVVDDRSSGADGQIAEQFPPQSTEALILEMLTHD